MNNRRAKELKKIALKIGEDRGQPFTDDKKMLIPANDRRDMIVWVGVQRCYRKLKKAYTRHLLRQPSEWSRIIAESFSQKG